MMNKLLGYLIVRLKDEYNVNIILNYIFKGTAIILSLIVTRMLLDYLDTTLYGIWVTITSVISWMSYGDLGIGNGLRNELAKAYGEGDSERQMRLIRAAFSSISRVTIFLFIIIIAISEFFFQFGIMQCEVRIPLYITSVFFCINLILGILQSIALGYQKSWLTTLTVCEMHIFSILGILVLTLVNIRANLIIYALVNGICLTIPNLVLFFILQKWGIKIWGLKRDDAGDKNVVKSIMTTGITFFGIQLCGLVLYSTDNLIINWKLNSEMVTKYDAITKVYNTGSNLFSILLVALWSAVTYHIAKDDINWVKKKIEHLLFLWVGFSAGVVAVSLFFNQIVHLWLGQNAYHYEWQIILLFGMYCSVTAFSAIFVNVLNGMGVIKLQFVLAVIFAIVNIPLSIHLAVTLHMGIFGVKMATFLCIVLGAIINPIQVWFELKKRTKS